MASYKWDELIETYVDRDQGVMHSNPKRPRGVPYQIWEGCLVRSVEHWMHLGHMKPVESVDELGIVLEVCMTEPYEIHEDRLDEVEYREIGAYAVARPRSYEYYQELRVFWFKTSRRTYEDSLTVEPVW